MEQSVVLVKPDGVSRGLIGEIVGRFEKAGLKPVAMKMVWIDKDLAFKHYGVDDDWFENIGQKIRQFYEEHGKDPDEEFGKMTNHQMGEMVQKWNVDYLTEGPVLAMIWEGPAGAVEIIRKIVGSTYPISAPPGTIRGDFGLDSPDITNAEKRSIHNLIHASGTVEEAVRERELWFRENEIYSEEFKNQ
ncbi:MAG: nucleoside-diphosphate kinase [Candidatus Shapirobacteria bacterium]|nr:nucleoside-diphosphate kinase [Candidatus Shapirobacteria bacterium]MDD5073877.1 nucleoside-diphosphate kinase [Candidatus Shapirobacteria bacterium]MDD5481470.1 nucleoside-diphosphate kinase [Candidatus Shapirobacteria bacterium]